MDDQKNDNMVNLWEQMGASTGSFVGKLIGYTAQYSLGMYEQAINNPLRRFGNFRNETTTEEEGGTGIREKTWGEMGREAGESVGNSIGMSMDLMINSMKSAADSTQPGYKENDPQTDKEKSDPQKTGDSQ